MPQSIEQLQAAWEEASQELADLEEREPSREKNERKVALLSAMASLQAEMFAVRPH